MSKKRRKKAFSANLEEKILDKDIQESNRYGKMPNLYGENPEEAKKIFLAAMDELMARPPPPKEQDLSPSPQNQIQPRKKPPSEKVINIDLHNCNLLDAQDKITRIVQSTLREAHGQVTFKIITGKGRHSGPHGSVLVKQIHGFVNKTFRTYICTIEDSPADLIVGNLPIRGFFHVVMQKK